MPVKLTPAVTLLMVWDTQAGGQQKPSILKGGEGRGETNCFDGGGGVAVVDGRGTSTNSRRVVEFVSGQTGRSMGGVLPGGSWESGLAHQRALIHFLKGKSWLKPPGGCTQSCTRGRGHPQGVAFRQGCFRVANGVCLLKGNFNLSTALLNSAVPLCC